MQEVNIFISYAKNDYSIVKKTIQNSMNFHVFTQNRIKFKTKFWWDTHMIPAEK